MERDTASLEVRSEVLSVDAVKISPMAAVLMNDGGRALWRQGEIVEPTVFTKVSALGVEEQRVVVISELISPPESWQRLGDGYRVEVRFIVWKSDKVLRVPTSAVFRVGDENAVFAVKEGKAYERPVKIGQRNGLTAEVLSGLEAGDEVITHPDSEIKDGSRVKIRTGSARMSEQKATVSEAR
jgi:HlyD family secretion protein